MVTVVLKIETNHICIFFLMHKIEITDHNSSWFIGGKGSQTAAVSNINSYSHRFGSAALTNLFSAPHLIFTLVDQKITKNQNISRENIYFYPM